MSGRIIKRESEARLPFPVIGKVKCGEKNERGLPRSLDYFVATGKYASLFQNAYDKPNVIQVVFPSDDASLVCKEEYEFRDTAGKLVADGDGENFRVWSNKTVSYTRVSTEQYPDIMNMVSSKYPSCEWRVTLTLRFIVPKVRGVMGVWEFKTKGSASSIPQVRDTFDAMLEQNGKVQGVIFDLSVTMAKSQKPNTNSRYPVVSLIPNESEANVRLVKECSRQIMIEE